MNELDDPEIIADLQLRSSSQYDSTRLRPGAESHAAWRPSRVIGKWKCRTPPCRNLVDVTEETMEYWAKCNGWLRARGEAPLDTETILRCESCEEQVKAKRGPWLRNRVDEIASVIRQLKDSRNPRNEEHLLAKLKK